MTEDEVRGFFAALSRGDREVLAGVLDEDVVMEFPGERFGGRFQGKRKVLVFLRQNQRLFRDGLEFTVHWTGVSGDRVIVQWTNAGITRDGQDYANRGVTVFRLESERVVEIQDYVDTEVLARTWPQ